MSGTHDLPHDALPFAGRDRAPARVPGRTAPPRRSSSAFFRQDLLEAVIGQPSPWRLVLVAAPHGYGKTELLGYWWQELTDVQRPARWVTLRPGDTAETVTALLTGRRGASGAGVCTAASDKLPQGTTLFIDNLDERTDRAVTNLINAILDGREDICVVVGSQTRSELPVARLASCGQVRQVTASDLAFDMLRTGAFISERLGLAADHQTVRDLLTLTEGWPAGVRLIASAAGSNLRQRDLTSLKVDRLIDRFFEEAVLTRLDAGETEQLVALANITSWRQDICEALLGDRFEPRLLEELYERQLFVSEGPDGNLRPHAMLRRCLQRRQNLGARAYRRGVSRKTAGVLAQHGEWAEAVDQALAAGMGREALQWAEQCAVEVAHRGETLRLRRWIAVLPEDQLFGCPNLCLAAAMTFYGMRQPETAVRYLTEGARRLSQALDEPGKDDAAGRLLLNELILLKTRYAVAADDSEAAIRILDHAFYPVEGKLEPSNSLCKAWCVLYERGATSALAALAQGDAAECTSPTIRMHRLHLECLAARLAGDMDRAEAIALVLHETAIVQQGATGPMTALATASLVRILYETDRLDAFDESADWLLPALHDCGSLEGMAAGYLVSIRTKGQAGRYEDAMLLIEQLEDFAHTHQIDRLLAFCGAERALLHLAAGDIGRASNALRDIVVDDDRAGPIAREKRRTIAVARAQVMIASGETEEAVLHLEELDRELEALGFLGELALIRVLLAVANFQLGRRGAAQRLLRQGLAMGEKAGLRRSLLDCGPALLPVLRNLRATGMNGQTEAPSRDYVDILIEGLGRAAPPALPLVVIGKVAGLSQRESEIAALIAKGLSNKEAGRLLDLSNETVKWHLKNIYDKLQVSSRAEATRRIMRMLREREGAVSR